MNTNLGKDLNSKTPDCRLLFSTVVEMLQKDFLCDIQIKFCPIKINFHSMKYIYMISKYIFIQPKQICIQREIFLLYNFFMSGLPFLFAKARILLPVYKPRMKVNKHTKRS